jgi:hypothetical protein
MYLAAARRTRCFNIDVFQNEISFNALNIEKNIDITIEYFTFCFYVDGYHKRGYQLQISRLSHFCREDKRKIDNSVSCY